MRHLRFRLVPKHISEEQFWRRYFGAVAQARAEVLRAEAAEERDFVRVPSLSHLLADERMSGRQSLGSKLLHHGSSCACRLSAADLSAADRCFAD